LDRVINVLSDAGVPDAHDQGVAAEIWLATTRMMCHPEIEGSDPVKACPSDMQGLISDPAISGQSIFFKIDIIQNRKAS
jgi:hypothetical protein